VVGAALSLTITAVEDAKFILVAAAELTAAKEPKP
jgi:hypothetical protein